MNAASSFTGHSIPEHTAKLILNEEKARDLQECANSAKEEIGKLDARCEPLENASNLLRIDVTSLEREMLKTEHHLHVLQSFKETTEAEMHRLDERLIDIESDGRIEKLEELYPRVSDMEGTIKDNAADANERLDVLDSKVGGTHSTVLAASIFCVI